MGSTWEPLAIGETPLDKVRATFDGMDVVAEGTGAGGGEWTRVHYAAVRSGDDVTAYVTMYAKQDGGVVYKSLHESVHPYYYTAPAKVMAALTPTDDECAQQWRAKVREEATKNYGGSRLEDGMMVTFDFTFGGNDTFYARRHGRSWRFVDVNTGGWYRLGGWTRIGWRPTQEVAA